MTRSFSLRIWRAAGCLPVALLFTSCRFNTDYDQVFRRPALYCDAVHNLNTVVMGNNFTPMVASRNYMYAAVAGYEVIAHGYPDRYISLAGQLRGLGAVPGPPAGPVDYEFSALLAFCKLGESVTFPAGSMKEYTDSLKELARDHGMPGQMYDNSIAYADTVASVIADWSRHDNYAETRSAPRYAVKDSPGRWIPTPPGYFSAAEPHWSEIRFVAVDSVTEFMPPPPYPFNVTDKNSPYYKEVRLIENKGDSLSPEEAAIADFWDDNPFKLNVYGHLMFGTKKFSPGGHWMGIVGIAAKKSGADFSKTAAAYALTSIALFDAFIECWNVKYTYNTMRPETVIDRYFDANWKPHLQTPPFPDYTCGHCCISASAAEALTSVFGDRFAYTDTTELEFGIGKRSYGSFRDAAMETMHSRFYGGIHYDYCCKLSNVMGKKIGDLVVSKVNLEKK